MIAPCYTFLVNLSKLIDIMRLIWKLLWTDGAFAHLRRTIYMYETL